MAWRRMAGDLELIAPALAFLCLAVPLAVLLDESGCFTSLAAWVAGRTRQVPVLALWVLAAVTTAVLNLDTTVVLLTPLYLRLAAAAGAEPLPLALVPLFLAGFASSFLPVSNLTTLVAAERLDLGTGDVLAHLGPMSLAACAAGWLAYRRRWPVRLDVRAVAPPDRHALVVGTVTVAVLLAGFLAGPRVGVAPWVVVAVVDVALVAHLRRVPWRSVPWRTAAGVAVLAAAVSLAGVGGPLARWIEASSGAGVAVVVLVATGAANAVNNLPALLVPLEHVHRASWGTWAWLAGVNTGAVLLPIGALANLLWRRVAAEEGVRVELRTYVDAVAGVALPALAAAAATLALQSALLG